MAARTVLSNARRFSLNGPAAKDLSHPVAPDRSKKAVQAKDVAAVAAAFWPMPDLAGFVPGFVLLALLPPAGVHVLPETLAAPTDPVPLLRAAAARIDFDNGSGM